MARLGTHLLLAGLAAIAAAPKAHADATQLQLRTALWSDDLQPPAALEFETPSVPQLGLSFATRAPSFFINRKVSGSAAQESENQISFSAAYGQAKDGPQRDERGNAQITWTTTSSSDVGWAAAYRFDWAEDKRDAVGATPAGDVEISRHSIRIGAQALVLDELHPFRLDQHFGFSAFAALGLEHREVIINSATTESENHVFFGPELSVSYTLLATPNTGVELRYRTALYFESGADSETENSVSLSFVRTIGGERTNRHHRHDED